MSPDDGHFTFEQMKPHIRANLIGFLQELLPFLSAEETGRRVEELMAMPKFVELRQGEYDDWSVEGDPLYREEFMGIHRVLFPHDGYRLSFIETQMQILLSALRDIVINPVLPVEYIQALMSGEGATEMPDDIIQERISMLMEYLHEQSRQGAILKSKWSTEPDQPDLDKKKLSSIISQLEYIWADLASLEMHAVYTHEEIDLYQLELQARDLIQRLNQIYNKVKQLAPDIEVDLLPYPELDVSEGEILALGWDNMAEYVKIRARRFSHQWDVSA